MPPAPGFPVKIAVLVRSAATSILQGYQELVLALYLVY